MPAIVAYKNNVTTGQDPFREGMKSLGKLLLDETAPAQDTDDKKRAGVKAALDLVIADPNLELRYQNDANATGTSKGFRIIAVDSVGGGSPHLLCHLENDQGADVGKLKLTVKMDDARQLNGTTVSNDRYSMRVNFPEPDDDNGATYLDETAAHLRVLFASSPLNDGAKNYLAAFKFLSRCK